MESMFPDAPIPLAEKYAPKGIGDFIGLDKQKKILDNFCARPMPCAWYFLGGSGLGKSQMAQAIARRLNAEVHHIPSQKANVETLEAVFAMCQRAPYRFFGADAGPASWHVIIIEETQFLTRAGQTACLSRLDGTAPLPNTIVIFTGNGTPVDGASTNQEKTPFLSRVRVLEFSSYGMRAPVAELLQKIWEQETGKPAPAGLNFELIAKEANNNVRQALQQLEIELLAA